MSEKIIGYDSYRKDIDKELEGWNIQVCTESARTPNRKDIDKELEGWKGYKNDGTVQSMLVEGAVRNSELIGRLLSIVETQQETITSLSQRVKAMEEGE